MPQPAVLFAIFLHGLLVVSARRLSHSGPQYWAAVKGEGSDFNFTGALRTYHIQAEEVVWDYAPQGRNALKGAPFNKDEDVFVERGVDRIGSKYLKCLYRGYTDASFKTRAAPPPAESYLTFLGPVIRAEVGDRIRVTFKNTCRFPATVHTHGVRYLKNSEGAPYDDHTVAKSGNKRDDRVEPGDTHVYNWEVPEQSGPAPADGSSVLWMYHSHTDEIKDTYGGLMGPLVVTARGMANPDGSPADVDREVFSLWSVMDENNSPYILDNLDRFGKRPRGEGEGAGEGGDKEKEKEENSSRKQEHEHDEEVLEDEEFGESNLMHSINGYVYGNHPMIVLCNGERVRWYNFAMGTEVDLHTPHWHGSEGFTVSGHRMDVISLLPASMIVADLVPTNNGIWMYHCHVNDHIAAGMVAAYRVTTDKAACTPK